MSRFERKSKRNKIRQIAKKIYKEHEIVMENRKRFAKEEAERLKNEEREERMRIAAEKYELPDDMDTIEKRVEVRRKNSDPLFLLANSERRIEDRRKS